MFACTSYKSLMLAAVLFVESTATNVSSTLWSFPPICLSCNRDTIVLFWYLRYGIQYPVYQVEMSSFVASRMQYYPTTWCFPAVGVRWLLKRSWTWTLMIWWGCITNHLKRLLVSNWSQFVTFATTTLKYKGMGCVFFYVISFV